MHQTALRYEMEVSDGGRLEIKTPSRRGLGLFFSLCGSPRTTFSDLTEASESTLEFWDNPIDDEEWNDDQSMGQPLA